MKRKSQTSEEKRYTATEIFTEKLLFKRNGQPYASEKAMRQRLTGLNIKKTGVSETGVSIYKLTQKDIDKINALWNSK